jgi:hypothetical protein
LPAGTTIRRFAVTKSTDDDPQPEARVVLPNDGNLFEGSAEPQTVSAQVTLPTPNHAGASVTFTRGGTAVRGATGTGAVGMVATDNQETVSWPANNNAPQSIDLMICGDTRDDDNDTIELNVTTAVVAAVAAGSCQVAASSPTNATIARAVGMVVIREP